MDQVAEQGGIETTWLNQTRKGMHLSHFDFPVKRDYRHDTMSRLESEFVMKLYGSKGCGSATPEALFSVLGINAEINDVVVEPPEATDPAYLAINPLGQVPALKLPDGTVITESVAIILTILDADESARLAPARGTSARAEMYRWITYCAFNIYAPIIVGDFPDRWCPQKSAQEEFKQATVRVTEEAWRVMDRAVKPAPYLLGPSMTALDIYVAMLSRWRPSRAWIDANCPNLSAAVKRTEEHPRVAEVWRRHFNS
jgi:GST-like protein